MAANVIFAKDLERQEKFLTALSSTGLRYKAAAAVGISYGVVQSLRKKDLEFEAKMLDALGNYADSISKEVYRRGVTGWKEPVFYQGKKIASIRKFDGKLLELEAKASRPTYYRDNVKIEGSVSGGVLLLNARMTVEEWEKKYGPNAEQDTPNDE